MRRTFFAKENAQCDSLHTWQWLASRSSYSYGKVLGRLALGGPCPLASQVGEQWVSMHFLMYL